MTVWGRTLPTVGCSFIICAVLGVSSGTIIATVGTDVTLPCTYDAKYHGKLSVCWGRGDLPTRGCANEVLKSDGASVISRLSERYLLQGNADTGDVSLTIRQLQESDSGTYGCRVEVPGWFNDLKYQMILSVNPVYPDPPRIETREVSTRTLTVGWTPGFDGGRPITNYMIHLKTKDESWGTALAIEMSNDDLTGFTLVDLNPGTTYNIRMFAMNRLGMSQASNVLAVATKEAAPGGPPQGMKLQALSPHSILVSWKPPRKELQNGILRSYVVSYRALDPATQRYRPWHQLETSATSQSVILTNLRPSTKYGILVQAKTREGIGPASSLPLFSTLDKAEQSTTASSVSHPLTTREWIQEQSPVPTVLEQTSTNQTSAAPDPIVVELKEVKDNIVYLSWSPGFEGGSPISGYTLEYKAVNASWDDTKTVVEFGSNQTAATIIEINPSTYNIRMFAKNSRATSKPSNILTFTTGEPGHHWNIATSATDAQASQVSTEETHGGNLTAILVPVLVVMLIAAIATVWQIRRVKQERGSLSMWLTRGAIRYKGAESLQEL